MNRLIFHHKRLVFEHLESFYFKDIPLPKVIPVAVREYVGDPRKCHLFINFNLVLYSTRSFRSYLIDFLNPKTKLRKIYLLF